MASTKGRAIQEARKARKISQEALAQGICDRSTISRIERGVYDPPDDLWRVLAERLNLPTNYPTQDGTASVATPPHTAIKRIRIALLNKLHEEAITLASITFWTLLDAGATDTALDFGLGLLKIFDAMPHTQTTEWSALITALLFHQVNRHAYHDVFRLGLVLQRLNGHARRYDDVIILDRTLLTLSPPLTTRAELLLGMGTAYLRGGRPADALVTYDQVLETIGQTESAVQRARALHGLSAAHLALGSWDTAQSMASQASIYYQALSHEFYWLSRQNWANAALHGPYRTDVALTTLEECAQHWMASEKYTEYLSVLEDIFVWSRGHDRTLAQRTREAARGTAEKHNLQMPDGFVS